MYGAAVTNNCDNAIIRANVFMNNSVAQALVFNTGDIAEYDGNLACNNDVIEGELFYGFY